MAKELDITPKIAARIKAAAGEDIDLSNLAVFETRAASTKPLSKSGSIYDKGRITAATLREMAEGLNSVAFAVPLMLMHDTGDLPSGKVFYADVLERQDGDTELRAQFYVPRDTGAELISKINSSTIDEVSVGMMAKSLMCSECGFDFFSPASLEAGNLWTREDPKGHVIGENGMHTISSGLNHWFELSLVGTGAAKDPKILTRTQARLSTEARERMAASGVSLAAQLLTTSFEKDSSMTDMTALVDKVAALSASEAVAKAESATALAEVTDLKAKLATAETRVTELEASAAEAAGTDAAKELTDAKAALALATEFLVAEAKKALIASGTNAEEPKTIEAAIAALKASGTNLVNTLVANGLSVAAGEDKNVKDKNVAKPNFAAFKSAPLNASR